MMSFQGGALDCGLASMPNAPTAKKSAREISRALQASIWKTTLSLRPRRSGSRRFLVSNHSGRLRPGQYYFSYHNPITHC